MSAKVISITGLCRNLGIDPSGCVDFVNIILSDCQPVQRIEDLTEEAYQTLLSRFREMKREQEREKERNQIKIVLSGKLSPEQEKKRIENNDRAMEEWRARRDAGKTPEQIALEEQKRIDYLFADQIDEDQEMGFGFGRKK